jgi:hypothetical protein
MQEEAISMFRNALVPVLMVTLLGVWLAVVLLFYSPRSDRGPSLDDVRIKSRLTYDDAHTKLLRCPQWKLTDSQSTRSFWVTLEERQTPELEDVVLVQDMPNPKSNRRGVVRVQPMHGPATTVSLDWGDSSYWRVVGDVHLAGDPNLVQEIAAYLTSDGGP